MKKLIVLIIFIPALFISCENQSPENTTLNLGFRAVGNSPDAGRNLRSSAGEGIFIDTAVLILERIGLSLKGSESSSYDPDNYILRGPYEIDLIAKKSRPDLLPAEIAPGTYTVLQAMLHIPEGYKSCIHITGTYTNNDNWWRITYDYADIDIFRVENQEGINIVEGASNNIWVLIDVVALFDGVDLSRAVPDENNVLRISSVSNSSLGSLIEDNFEIAAVIDNGKGETPVNDDKISDDEDDQDNGDSVSDDDNAGMDDDEDVDSSGDENNGPDGDDGGGSGSENADDGNDGDNGNGNNDKDKSKDKSKDKNKDKNKDKHKDKVNNNNHKDKDKDKDNNKDKDKENNNNKDKNKDNDKDKDKN